MLFSISGIQIHHGIEVELPSRASFDPWGWKVLHRWTPMHEDRWERPSRVRVCLRPLELLEAWRYASPPQWEERYQQLESIHLTGPISGPTTTTVVEIDPIGSHSDVDFGWVLSSLRLYCPGDLHPGPQFIPRPGTEAGVVAEHGGWRDHPSTLDLGLDAAETDGIAAFLEAAHTLTPWFHERSELGIARRFFSRSLHLQLRHGRMHHPQHEFNPRVRRLEDVVFNLVVALEALTNLGDGSKEGAFRRTVDRAAALWEGTSIVPCSVSDLIDWAYDTRSLVAHGSFKTFKRKTRYGSAFGPESCHDEQTMVAVLRSLVRQTIVAMGACYSAGLSRRAIREGLDAPASSGQRDAVFQARDSVHVLEADKDVAVTHVCNWRRACGDGSTAPNGR